MALDRFRFFLEIDGQFCERNRWMSVGEMSWMRDDPLVPEQRHQMGSSWDCETAIWSIGTSADDLHHWLSS